MAARSLADRFHRSLKPFGWTAFGFFGLWFTWRLIVTWAGHLRHEDQLIVLRYARNLVEGNGLVYNIGERVMGFTTPLFTLLSAGAVAFGGDSAPAWQNTFGVFCLLGTAAVAARLLVRLGAGAAAPLAVALITLDGPSIPRYFFLGMEVHLFSLLYLLALDLHLSRRESATGAATGALFLTRPEGALLAGMLLTHNWISTRLIPVRQAVAAAAIALPWLTFAVLYFGSFTTETLKAKRGIFSTWDYLETIAVNYDQASQVVLSTYTSWSPLVRNAGVVLGLTVLVGAIDLLRRERDLWPLIAFPPAIVLGYAMLGAWPGFTWHFYPVYVMVPLLQALGVHAMLRVAGSLARRLFQRLQPLVSGGRPASVAERNTAAAVTVLTILLALPALLHTRARLETRLEPTERDRTLAALGNYLGDHYAEDVRVLVDEIGYIGWLSRLHIIDSQGLVTADLNWDVPRIEALDRHVPDLVLVHVDARTRHAMQEIVPWMYRPIEDFDAAPEYRLYSRIDPLFRYEKPPNQAALLRYRTDDPAAPPKRIPIVRSPEELSGFLDETRIPTEAGEDGRLLFNGWAVDSTNPDGLEAIVVLLGGTTVGATTVDLPRRPDVAGVHGRDFEYSGFILRSRTDRALLEREGVIVLAVSRQGFASRLRFHYNRLEHTGQKGEILPTSDGRRLRIRPPDELVDGSFNVFVNARGETRIEGWAADIERGQRPRQIVIYRDGQFLTNLGLTHERPTIVDRFGDERLRRTGFRGVVPQAPEPETFSHRHRVFAVMLRGDAVELPLQP